MRQRRVYQTMRSNPRRRSFLAVSFVVLVATACGQAGQPPVRTPSVITSPGPACSEFETSFSLSLRNADDGRTYDLVLCQSVQIALVHPEADGCGWTTVQSSDEKVMVILAIPYPPPPRGGTLEAYQAIAPGQATLESELVCGTDAVHRGSWSVRFRVKGWSR